MFIEKQKNRIGLRRSHVFIEKIQREEMGSEGDPCFCNG